MNDRQPSYIGAFVCVMLIVIVATIGLTFLWNAHVDREHRYRLRSMGCHQIDESLVYIESGPIHACVSGVEVP